ncbi:MAG: tryptophan--tRNA ligase [bacterium]
MKKVLLSGIKPTGDMHLGNYFGAIKQFIDMQDSYESYIFIADLHALTTVRDRAELRKNIFTIAATYMACGLDPKKVTLFQQSAIGGELCELTWMFNCLTTVPYLERAVAYKDAVANGKEATVGLFDYPILMAADILMQNPDVVPVGSDQKQHIEYARDTAEKFNRIWGEQFKMPEPLILESTGIVPGLDGRKMSKSYGNTIPLFASDAEIEKAVMSIVTDSSGDVPVNVYAIHKLFKSEAELAPLYEANKGKYKALKDALASDIKAFVTPMRARYEELLANPKIVEDVLSAGAEVVKTRAEQKMVAVKKGVGLLL